MTLDNFYPVILPEVIGCPDPTVKSALIMASIEFCRESLAWTEIKSPIALIDGTSDYVITPSADAYLVAVRDIWIGNRRLKPVTMMALQDAMPNWITSQSNEPIFYNAAASHGSVRVFPTPANTTGQSFVVRASYAPTATAETLPDFLCQRYLEVIASGAKARLMMITGVPWSNPQMAAYYKQLFDNSMVNARIDEAHDRVPGTITVRPRSFGF